VEVGMAEKKELKSLGYEIFIGVLSILSILNLILGIFIPDPDIAQVLNIMNWLFSIIFIIDFIYRILTAPSKSNYFFRQFGWADLLASLPFEQTKILRIFRLVRVYRLMRAVGPKTVADTLLKDRAGSALIILLLMGILVLEFGSLAILRAEEMNPDANIKTASDAIWYTMVTISTVGYGDRYPTTNWGRIIGTLIIIIGVGIFGTFTGYLANLFLSPQKKEESGN
jgi:voltage-gated potassium channel